MAIHFDKTMLAGRGPSRQRTTIINAENSGPCSSAALSHSLQSHWVTHLCSACGCWWARNLLTPLFNFFCVFRELTWQTIASHKSIMSSRATRSKRGANGPISNWYVCYVLPFFYLNHEDAFCVQGEFWELKINDFLSSSAILKKERNKERILFTHCIHFINTKPTWLVYINLCETFAKH